MANMGIKNELLEQQQQPKVENLVEVGSNGRPLSKGLYDPANEKDACGAGIIVDLSGNQKRNTVEDALTMLERMDHRGACGCEENTGDGAGMMISLPRDFMRRVASEQDITLPEDGKYIVGQLFMPVEPEQQQLVKAACEETAAQLKLDVLGWRTVPVDNSTIGYTAKLREPSIAQMFCVPKQELSSNKLEAYCYVFLKITTNMFENKYADKFETLPHWCSVSSRTIVYKGQLLSGQLPEYYPDLRETDFKSNMCMVHSRFSTNTFPSWDRAQPLRNIAHNGEINTLRGNKNWFLSRQGLIKAAALGLDTEITDKLFPILEEDRSDSGVFDNVLGLLMACGREAPEAMMMLIPEAWQNHPTMSDERRAFYEFHSALVEPWDGPALVMFSDGNYVGGALDRNGLRPGRFIETHDGHVYMSSEVGTITVAPERIKRNGRLSPGNLFLIDLIKGEITDDVAIKQRICSKQPYRDWLTTQVVNLGDLETTTDSSVPTPQEFATTDEMIPTLSMFGWTLETVNILIIPMSIGGVEPLGSMGNDSPLAVLSKVNMSVFDYFKQLFAQVTNPPLDSTRESCVMSLETMVGPEGDITECQESQCHRLRLPSPIVTLAQMQNLKNMDYKGWKSQTIDITCAVDSGSSAIEDTINRIIAEVNTAVEAGFKVVILSDAAAGLDRVPVNAALIVGAVHHSLIASERRTRVAIALDSGEVSQVHHICVCVGYGLDIVCPRTSFQFIQAKGFGDEGVQKYINGVHKGMLKIMAKMGISTLQSYKGAQIFEAVGLSEEVVNKCFVGTASRLGGETFKMLSDTAIATHVASFKRFLDGPALMRNPGDYHYRSNEGSEVHLNDPATIAKLQDAARTNSQAAYSDYARMVNDLNKKCTIRGQLRFKAVAESARVPLDQVEPASEIVKRFCTGAMSYGSISLEAHSTLAIAMNKLGGKSNTGEGGEAAERLEEMEDGSRNPQRSAIKQVASGRFGVTAHYLSNADEIQIKMAQGAKPGEGGELPGYKVVGAIAKCRGSTPGVGLISPPPHHDIYSIEDLKQLIYDLKNANDSARISVKLVSEVGVGIIAAGVVKGKADHVLISGHDGGTGASRWSGIKHAGLPWELGLAETQQTLVMNNLRSRVVVQTDGQLKTGRDVAIAALIGAEEFGFATAPLIAMGCIMMRKCHLNTCPVGIATQDPELRKKFKGTPEHVQNFLFLLAEEVRTYMAEMGFKTMKEMTGRVDMLEADPELAAVTNLDFSKVLHPATSFHKNAATTHTESQNHQLEDVLDRKLVIDCADALQDTPVSVSLESPICNINRSTGTILSHTVTKKFGAEGLPNDTIHIEFKGYAGQSYGAWLCKGIFFDLVGAVNDFCGKGLCGGTMVVRVPEVATFKSHENVICGNVGLYGATSGRAFFNGKVGERFCVRNSGAMAVCEGVGDHCCEYMTGGRIVVLGGFGRNFGAGMSGGIAYVYDPDSKMQLMSNMELIEIGPVELPENLSELKSLVQQHRRYTKSKLAASMLDDWTTTVKSFVRVMPRDYRLALEELARTKNATTTTPPRSKRPRSKKPKPTPAVSTPTTTDSDSTDMEDGFKIPTISRPTQVANPGKKRGFIEYSRKAADYRPAAERIKDWKEISHDADDKAVVLKTQTARCMDCGVPFCHQKKTGCPLGNRIPEWNEYVFQGNWRKALDALLATNNFPEFTGRVCPAPCEGACVLGIIEKPVTIKSVECTIIDHAFREGWMVPKPPSVRTGKTVAIVGGGPAGMAAADQLNKAGHTVVVYERADRIGGLMMYGVPNMKCDKDEVVQRRVDLMTKEGVTFKTSTALGKDISLDQLKTENDAVLLAIGSTIPRDLTIPGRELSGVHFAMEYLTKNTKSLLDSNHADEAFINVKGKKVVVIGGGDTGNDCIGTSVRLGASAVVNLELLPQPPQERAPENPWPEWPRVFRVDYGHEEVAHVHGKDPRKYEVLSKEFINDGNGNLTGIKTVGVKWTKDDNGRWKMGEVEGSEMVIEADFVFLAMGFIGPEVKALEGESTIELNRGTIKAETEGNNSYATTEAGVFAAGDCRRGQSLVVWAIAEGRNAAASICTYLESK